MNLESRPSEPPPLRGPFVGRLAELTLLENALSRVLASKTPHVVTITSSPGLGKTRLVSEFLEDIRGSHPEVRIFRAVCRQTGPAFGPIRRILRSRFGISEGSPLEETQETFRHAVTEVLGDKRVTEFLHFLGSFIELKFPESPFIAALEHDAAQFRTVSATVLRRFFEVDASTAPLLLTFEDLHLSHDDTLRLVEQLSRTLSGAPILIINTSRPELFSRHEEFMKGHAEHTQLTLGPLTVEESADLVRKLLPFLPNPPAELVDTAVDMAAGSPYLLEQIVRTYLEAGAIAQEGSHWTTRVEMLPTVQLPLTVNDAIAARIASLLPAERRLLEMASALGGVFWLGALVALGRVDKTPPELWGGAEDLAGHYRDLLKSLEERDYVLALPDASLPGEREWVFKHNLERETLHQLTSPADLRRYHLVIAEWLEFRLAERAEEHCEMLAQHYELGGAKRKAAQYLLLAGDRARARYANTKAAEYYERGLDMLGDEDAPLHIETLHNFGDVLQLAGRNDEALVAFRKMLDIAFKLDLRAKGGAAHNRIGRLYRSIGHLDEAMRHLGTAHALFESVNDLPGIAASHDDVGKVHWMRGNYPAAEQFMRKALEIRQVLEDKRSIALSYNNLGLVFQDSGRFAEAQVAFREALNLRKEIGDQPGIAQTLNNLGTVHQDAGEHDKAVQLYTEALEVAREVGDRMRQAVILTNLGESHYRFGRPAEAIRVLKQAEHIAATLGDLILEGEILRGLGKAHLFMNDIALARDYVRRSIQFFEKARGKAFLGIALRTLGEVAAADTLPGGGDAEAVTAFERATELFEELGNEIELARTCEAYAKLLEKSSSETVASEVQKLRERANTIMRKIQASDYTAPLEPARTVPVHRVNPNTPDQA